MPWYRFSGEWEFTVQLDDDAAAQKAATLIDICWDDTQFDTCLPGADAEVEAKLMPVFWQLAADPTPECDAAANQPDPPQDKLL